MTWPMSGSVGGLGFAAGSAARSGVPSLGQNFTLSSNSLPHVRNGKLKAYAVTAKGRLPSAPDIPSVDEVGMPGFYISVWHGMHVDEKKFMTTGLPRYSARVPVVPSKRLNVASMGPPARPPLPPPVQADTASTATTRRMRRRNISVEGSGPHRRAGARVRHVRDGRGDTIPTHDKAVAPARSFRRGRLLRL